MEVFYIDIHFQHNFINIELFFLFGLVLQNCNLIPTTLSCTELQAEPKSTYYTILCVVHCIYLRKHIQYTVETRNTRHTHFTLSAENLETSVKIKAPFSLSKSFFLQHPHTSITLQNLSNFSPHNKPTKPN